MQDAQNVHLNPRPAEADHAHAREMREEALRRGKTRASGSDGVQFSTIFSMIDSGLDVSADSIRKLPKGQARKETETRSESDLPIAAAAEVKAAATEAPKEAPKAKTEQAEKPRAEKAESAKKAEAKDKQAEQAVAAEKKADTQSDQKSARLERETAKSKVEDKPKAEASNVRENVETRREKSAAEQVRAAESAGPAVEIADADQKQSEAARNRRGKVKEKDADDRPVEVRQERRGPEVQKAARSDDDRDNAPKVREKPEAKAPVQQRAEAKAPEQPEKRIETTDSKELGHTDEKAPSESRSRKKGIGDLEKLTGLEAKPGVEVVAAAAVLPTADAGARAAAEAVKVTAVETAKAPAKAAPASQSSNQTQQHTGADAEAKSGKAEEKVGQTAKRLASYLSGKAEQVKPEATFADMAAKAKLFVENGRSEMTIQLNPEHLGSLKIQMVVEDGKMQAHFVTDRAEVKALIENNADTLKEKLGQVGIEVGALSVEVRNDAGNANPQDDRPSGLRKVTEFGGKDSSDSTEFGDAAVAYALAGRGTHLSLVA